MRFVYTRSDMIILVAAAMGTSLPYLLLSPIDLTFSFKFKGFSWADPRRAAKRCARRDVQRLPPFWIRPSLLSLAIGDVQVLLLFAEDIIVRYHPPVFTSTADAPKERRVDENRYVIIISPQSTSIDEFEYIQCSDMSMSPGLSTAFL